MQPTPSTPQSRVALILGAGPAGLTAALELLRRTDVRPLVLEASHEIGGLSRTVVHNGNRMDIGGHRFFSKSSRVMQWWQELVPVGDPQKNDLVFLVRSRKSSIRFLRRFFDYPVRLTAKTIRNMGLLRSVHCGLSYLRSAILPPRQQSSLEDFLIRRFGRQLYKTFFQSYTEKVWGIPCSQISADWGAQRIKGLTLTGVVLHFLRSLFSRSRSQDLAQKETETSLIGRFLYPKFGPGQLWEHVVEEIRARGGEIHFGVTVDSLLADGNQIVAVEGSTTEGTRLRFDGEFCFSSMPVRDLIRAMGEVVPAGVRAISDGLIYRDFLTVGLLVKKLAVAESDGTLLRDNWIYIQEPDVAVGRLQIFNNWSPWLVADPNLVWLGLEYFCTEGDSLWSLSEEAMRQLATEEVERIGILHAEDVVDAHVVRVPKAYPAYFGSYGEFQRIREFTDGFENLFLIGRNGMHRYNNQDHSMLTAMTAVDNIVHGVRGKENLWQINTETEYHEERQPAEQTD